MQIELLVSRYKSMIGIARYTFMLQKHLTQIGVEYENIETSCPPLFNTAQKLLRPLGYDIREFTNIFPVDAPFSPNAVKHLTTQMMAFLFSFKPGLRKTVITVCDIIPFLMRDDPKQNVYRHFYDRMIDDRAMRNIRCADKVISISAFTGKTLVDRLGVDPDKICVVPLAVDREEFYPVPVPPDFRARFGLESGSPVLLYVGSENPRKNLPFLIRVIEKVKRVLPRVKLVKIGSHEYHEQYDALKSQISSAGLSSSVVFIENASHADLLAFYSAADAFVFPSLYEGFGLPPLEAMACGLPVICSNSSSLPEVVGNAAVSLDPADVDGWAEAILRVMEDRSFHEDLRERGLRRAAEYTWERTARQTFEVYQSVDARA